MNGAGRRVAWKVGCWNFSSANMAVVEQRGEAGLPLML